MIHAAIAKNRGGVCLLQTENKELFIIKTMMANYG